MRRNRRFIAAVCIAAVFFAAIVPVAASLFAGVLVPLPPLFGLVLCADAPAPQSLDPQPFPARVPLPGRAPPA